MNVSAEEVFFTKETRLPSSVSKEQDPKKIMILISKGTPTEVLGLDSTKKFPAILIQLNLNSRTCHRSYLHLVLLMMALKSKSAIQAVMNMYIHDTVV